MTTNEIKTVMAEWLKGKPRQCRYYPNGLWCDLSQDDYRWLKNTEYRIKPEKQKIRLSRSNFPPTIWIRNSSNPNRHSLIVRMDEYNLYYYNGMGLEPIPFSHMNDWEYSEDRVNWKPFYKETND